MGNQDETQDGSAKSIFLDALEVDSAGDRSAYIDRRCGSNPELRAEVDALLRHHGRLEDYLELPAVDPDATKDEADLPFMEGSGTVIGPYKLLEPIGQGGMGQVYMAEQAKPVRRMVALKIIKPGMDTRQVIARFEAERQALALMDHPNIAKVLDAGATEKGRPYFVMELVRGIPITDYCDREHLTVPERLDLFVLVCRAVQHAHQKGIIHRDLKPSNVLVTLHDGEPVPKVIDFGIAKATGQQLTDRTLFTGFSQLVGTPLYMSPEQAALSGLDIDTRSDIYSLGVLLYELLTGTTPFDQETMRKAAFDEMRRIICENEPLTPSSRLSTLGATLATVSANRKVDRKHLSRQVRGELDWIVMKALEKDRRRRYETASSFAADVRRYLADEAVEACPPSTRYRFAKFARRNRAALTTAAVVAAALLSGLGISAWQAIRATKAERNMATALRTAEAQRQLARRAVDEMYTQVAEEWLADRAQMTDVQRKFLKKALEFYREFARGHDSDPALRRETALAYRRVGDIQASLGGHAEAEAAYLQAISILDGLTDQPDGLADLAGVHARHAELLDKTGRFPDAERAYRRAVKILEAIVARSPAHPGPRVALASVSEHLGEFLKHRLDRARDAEPFSRRALQLREALVDESPADPEFRAGLAHAIYELSYLLLHTNRIPEAARIEPRALELYRKLVAEYPSRRDYRHGLAINSLHWSKLEPKEKESSIRRALELLERLVGEFPGVPDYRADLAKALIYLADIAKPGEAEPAARRALDIAEKVATEFPDVPLYGERLAIAHLALVDFYWPAGRHRETEQAIRKGLEIAERVAVKFYSVGGRERPNCMEEEFARAQVMKLLCTLLEADGRLSEAEEVYRKAVAYCATKTALLPDRPYYPASQAKYLNDLARLMFSSGRLREAEQCLRQALDLDSKLTSEFLEIGDYKGIGTGTHTTLVGLLKAMGRPREAEEVLSEGVRRAKKVFDSSPRNFGACLRLRDLSAQAGRADTLLEACRRSCELEPENMELKFQYAFHLVYCSDPRLRNPARAVALAKEIVARKPGKGVNWWLLGAARYRAGEWKASAEALEKRIVLDSGSDASFFFLAMARWRLGEEDQARRWYDRAIVGMESHKAQYRVMQRLRDEAAALLGRPIAPTTAREEDAWFLDPLNDDHVLLNNIAWGLTTAAEPRDRDPARAVELAKKAVDLAPGEANNWDTLGMAQYRAGDWQSAITASEKSNALKPDSYGFRSFVLAMAHWQRGDQDQARTLYDKAVALMEKNRPDDEKLRRFCAEAADLLGLPAEPKHEAKVGPP